MRKFSAYAFIMDLSSESLIRPRAKALPIHEAVSSRNPEIQPGSWSERKPESMLIARNPASLTSISLLAGSFIKRRTRNIWAKA